MHSLYHLENLRVFKSVGLMLSLKAQIDYILHKYGGYITSCLSHVLTIFHSFRPASIPTAVPAKLSSRKAGVDKQSLTQCLGGGFKI